MTDALSLLCDGCGRPASAEHIARRLQRLECTTRWRPIHISTLLLGAVASKGDSEFLYAPTAKFQGESRSVLEGVGVDPNGKSPEEVLAEFQRGGFLLAHVLECPLESGTGGDPFS